MTQIMANFPIKVRAYSGYKACERPVSFTLGEKVFEVEEIIDRWCGEDHDYFKLRADNGCIYIIRYDRDNDSWELIVMEDRKTPSPP